MISHTFARVAVAIFLELHFIAPPASAVTLSAATGDGLWRNTTRLSIASSFEYHNFEDQPKATLRARPVLHTSRSRASAKNYHRLVANGTSSPVVAPTVLASLASAGHVSWPTFSPQMPTYMNDVAINLEALISAHTHNLASANVSLDAKNPGSVSIKPTGDDTAESTLKLNPPRSSASILNTTSLHHVLIAGTNTTFVLSTVLSIKTPTTSGETRFRRFINKINTVLPYVDACGLLVILWEVGKFVHAKVRAHRSKNFPGPHA